MSLKVNYNRGCIFIGEEDEIRTLQHLLMVTSPAYREYHSDIGRVTSFCEAGTVLAYLASRHSVSKSLPSLLVVAGSTALKNKKVTTQKQEIAYDHVECHTFSRKINRVPLTRKKGILPTEEKVVFLWDELVSPSWQEGDPRADDDVALRWFLYNSQRAAKTVVLCEKRGIAVSGSSSFESHVTLTPLVQRFYTNREVEL